MKEAEVQRAVLQHLSYRAKPGLIYFAVPNGGWRSPIEARKLKGQGVTPGAPDLMLIYRSRAYGLELKPPDKGRASDAQLAMQQRFIEAGAYYVIAHGVDEAVKTLQFWELLR